MDITHTTQKINLNNVVDVSVDVHKSTLCFFLEIDGTVRSPISMEFAK